MARKTAVLSSIAALLLLSFAFALPPEASSYATLKAEAEKHYAEKSFSRAKALYEQAAKLELTADERRWVRFRLADTAWRADVDERENAQKELETLIKEEPRDRTWAEANESLGDLHLDERRGRNFYAALPYYNAALDWWAGSDEIELARRRYLAMVWRLSVESTYIPRDVVLNAISIAQTPEDRARARFLLVQQLTMEGRPESLERALEHLEAIIAEGKKTEWYDDALYAAAAQLSQERGHVQVLPSGEIEYQTDYLRALEYFRRIITEFKRPETPFYDDAEEMIGQITRADVGVMVSGTFLPDSEQQIVLSWRNVKAINIAVTPVDLTTDSELKDGSDWLDTIRATKAPIRRWTFETPDRGPHRPSSEPVRIEPRLAPGAYLVTASGGGKSSRQLLVITDAHVLAQSSGGQTQVFVSNVLTGEPIANARVTIWQQLGRQVIKKTGQTRADGLATFEALGDGSGRALITASAGEGRQAWHMTWHYWSSFRADAHWRIYAFTDRPAYRPNETVQWKIIARVRDHDRWSTPANQTLHYEITSPRGEKVSEGKATLNQFGSFWAELPLTATMPLGAYTITFHPVEAQREVVGHAALFRLEEYKLPEFQVRVTTPEGKQYRLGDTIDAQIEAEYYFGGPVANATVEAVIYQEPLYRPWYPWREYSWYFPEPPTWRGQASVLRRETLTTDANGRASLRIETSRDGGDVSYRIEARVVDASRREVRGQGTVRVTRQRYTVHVRASHLVHRPGDPVEVEIKALDANDKPVQVEGSVTVVRRTMEREENVSTTRISTNASGEATFTFTPKREGYYVIKWRSEDREPGRAVKARDIVTAETTVWVADRRTTDLGFRGGGLDLVIDKESFKPGEKVHAIVVTPASGRWVVVTASANEILDTQVVRLDGTVKLVEFDIDERHSPNFYLTAVSIFDRQLSMDSERVVVPPVRHFLDVEVTSDREDYRPREEATLTITTRDSEGKPVPAEVAVSVSDEAVTAIQQDPAGDPRQFFFGDIRPQMLQVTAGLHSQQYVRLVVRDGRLVDDRHVESLDDARRRGEVGAKRDFGYAADAVTVTAGAPVMEAMPSPAPPPAPAAPVMQEAAKIAAEPQVAVEVRTDFRSTAFWKPDVVTDASGTATVRVKFPEALTTWRATARAATSGAQFGMATDTAKTNLPLIVRLQAPRFFVVGDKATVSAVVNNNTDEAMNVTASIEWSGGLQAADGGLKPAAPLTVPAHGEARADWQVSADVAGQATLRVSARGGAFGDAMEKTFTVYEHGIDKLIAKSGKLRGDEALIKLDLPRERRATELTINVAPTLGQTMIDALPYLVAFPYGCTEQTMSRFLPAAIVARSGLATGIKNLDAVTREGMNRLYDMQHANGGWGWWKESATDDWMTAYVVWGFAVARDADLPVRKDAVDRAAEYLRNRLAERERDHNDSAWMLHALSAWRKTPSAAEKKAFERVYANRERLTSYSRALLALTAHRYGESERAKVLVRNLEDGVKIDRTPDQSVLIRGGESSAETMATAHWGASGFWWRWHEGPIETTAFALQALVNIQPDHKLIEPAMNWLIKNRRGARWSNTRDTAIAVLALTDYLRVSGELKADVAYEVSVNGTVIGSATKERRFSVDPALLRDTTQEIRIRRTSGSGPLYFASEARFVSLEEPVKAAGNELFVKREYFRLRPRPTLLKGVLYDRVPLPDGAEIASNERLEVVITIETKNDYSYLMFEDLKPAGLEAVELQSGQPLYATSSKRGSAFVYQELRDRKVALFIDHLQQGIWEIRYTLRAEVPGTFHALPVIGQAMYVPDIRGNSDEVRLTVR